MKRIYCAVSSAYSGRTPAVEHDAVCSTREDPTTQAKSTRGLPGKGLELLGPSKMMSTIREQIRHLAAKVDVVIITGAPDCGQYATVEMLLQASRLPSRQIIEVSNERADRLLTASANHSWQQDLMMYCPSMQFLSDGAQQALSQLLSSRQSGDSRFVFSTEGNLSGNHYGKLVCNQLVDRLRPVQIALPSLRERREDLPFLFDRIMTYYCKELHRPLPLLSRSFLDSVVNYSWPGQFKQLYYVASSLASAHLHEGARQTEEFESALQKSLLYLNSFKSESSARPCNATLEDVITRHVLKVRSECLGNRTKMAAELGVSRSTVYRLLSGLGPIAS